MTPGAILQRTLDTNEDNMLARGSKSIRILGFRWNSTSNAGAKFLSPTELIAQKKADALAEQEYKQDLLSEKFTYSPQILSKETIDPVSKRPIPLNVELLKYKAIKLPKTHGHKVALITFKGFDPKELDHAAEFAARAAFYLGIPCGEPSPQRVQEKLITVIRSPFAQAKSKENFKKYTYGRNIVAYDANPEVVDTWLSFINKHKFDDIKYKAFVYTRESGEFVKELDALTAGDLKLPDSYAGATDPVSQKVAELLKSEEFKKFFDEEQPEQAPKAEKSA